MAGRILSGGWRVLADCSVWTAVRRSPLSRCCRQPRFFGSFKPQPPPRDDNGLRTLPGALGGLFLFGAAGASFLWNRDEICFLWSGDVETIPQPKFAVSNKTLKRLSRSTMAPTPRGVSDKFLPTPEVYDEVKDTRVLFSFASANGGLHVAKRLRELVVSEFGSPCSGYVDCVNLWGRVDTVHSCSGCDRTVSHHESHDTPCCNTFARTLNTHWAEFYFMSMLTTHTFVVVLDEDWRRGSPWCNIEEVLMRSNMSALASANGMDASRAGVFDLIIVYNHKLYPDGPDQARREVLGDAATLFDHHTVHCFPADFDGPAPGLLSPKALAAYPHRAAFGKNDLEQLFAQACRDSTDRLEAINAGEDITAEERAQGYGALYDRCIRGVIGNIKSHKGDGRAALDEVANAEEDVQFMLVCEAVSARGKLYLKELKVQESGIDCSLEEL